MLIDLNDVIKIYESKFNIQRTCTGDIIPYRVWDSIFIHCVFVDLIINDIDGTNYIRFTSYVDKIIFRWLDSKQYFSLMKEKYKNCRAINAVCGFMDNLVHNKNYLRSFYKLR